jgi:hypothetical protein
MPSWPGIAVRRTASRPLGYARLSTFLITMEEDVVARHKAGHDDHAPSSSANRRA